ncbi:MAG: glycosyltransferase family 2 protein [Hyphomonadaceae bacterium]|nr:glycosyltransferase family 2 protein [Hyphomonadaceae bacterium]
MPAAIEKIANSEISDAGFAFGVLIPTYQHTRALPDILRYLTDRAIPVIVVDDGNPPEIAARIQEICQGFRAVHLEVCAVNGGKGSAVKHGLRAAAGLGWTHAIQLDADGQHDVKAVVSIAELARNNPDCVICAIPIYDDSIPKARRIGREITHFWVRLETMSNEIRDSMCGLRAYPLGETLAVVSREFIGNRMDFDTEILVHLSWRGLRIIELPVRVTYPEENISNFRMIADNVRISLMHTRLFLQSPVRVPIRLIRRLAIARYRRPGTSAM